MFRIEVPKSNFIYDVEELVKVFMRGKDYDIVESLPFIEEKNKVKAHIFNNLKLETGYSPPWGTLTGVRPVKIAKEMAESGIKNNDIIHALRNEYLMRDDKIRLVMETLNKQLSLELTKDNQYISVYIGIPFCPTICEYCSFASSLADEDKINKYLDALLKEIREVSLKIFMKGKIPESIYIGGGTPTAMSEIQLDRLLSHIVKYFDMTKVREFTLEAGRPDTITWDKLKIIKKYSVGRISINPQTMHQDTLTLIGREHTVDDVYKAVKLVNEADIGLINADVIAGLPGEDNEQFIETLEMVKDLNPDNITVHTLAIKKGSKLKDKGYEILLNDPVTEKMNEDANRILLDSNYHPYYLYRQKNIAGNLENVGYAKRGAEGIYNIRIMDEKQSIIAFGAGGVGKMFYPEENRLERVPNVTDIKVYIDRIDEMIKRKDIFFE